MSGGEDSKDEESYRNDGGDKKDLTILENKRYAAGGWRGPININSLMMSLI